MRAGQLTHRCLFKSPRYSCDNQGQQLITAWVDTFTLWGRVEPYGGSEYEKDRAMVSDCTHRVTVRWTSQDEILPNWRILVTSRRNQASYLEIVSVLDTDLLGKMVVLNCVEIVDTPTVAAI